MKKITIVFYILYVILPLNFNSWALVYLPEKNSKKEKKLTTIEPKEEEIITEIKKDKKKEIIIENKEGKKIKVKVR